LRGFCSGSRPWSSESSPRHGIVTSLAFTQAQVNKFHEDGFLVVNKLLDPAFACRIRDKFPLLFRGEFETGIYPDEWHWREGMSRDDVTREIVNAWKTDRTIASVVLSDRLGSLMASLMRWDGVRVGQDDIWWKPPGTKSVTFHQDSAYFDFIEPAGELITCWIALDDTSKSAGTLEYIPGSHKWPTKSEILKTAFFHI